MNKFQHAIFTWRPYDDDSVLRIPVVIIGYNKDSALCIVSKQGLPGGWSTDPQHVQRTMNIHNYKLFDGLNEQDLYLLNYNHGKFVSAANLESIPEFQAIVLNINYELDARPSDFTL